MAEVSGEAMPEPESEDLGRYLEDTITIDWQTPAVMTASRRLLEGVVAVEDRVRVLFDFVRDEVHDVLGLEEPTVACSASQVLREQAGFSFAQSHLLAGLLRCAGFPAGFCYVRLADGERPGRFVLHGFNGVYWRPADGWIYLDAMGGGGASRTEVRFGPPWSLCCVPDPDAGEGFLPFIYRRPGKRIIDLLERAPDVAALRRNWPDAL